ncbi:hypothetical protein A8C32_13610 [Flavivirga aquatica]|uniref:Glycine zipper family protein n=1 Tax=Flavivirga aquatica TaxID=1849968 RepID=A0A1E5TC50_9FLAO|nr:hypothetical protein [Flavivirga aquatica]OEK08941.1 hypothetical protein A8C32_13610 [Flavivirga aquatica]
MSIKETIEFFKNLLKETSTKNEIKVYQSFISILLDLGNKDLTEGQISRIEEKIKTMNLKSSPKNKRKYFNKKLTVFKQFLKDEFSLIIKGYYTSLGVSLGMVLGMCFGVIIGVITGAFGNSVRLALWSALGMIIGLTIGLIIGRNKDIASEKLNRILK